MVLAFACVYALVNFNVSVCFLCRSGLHDPDAAGQSELVHQPVDLHSFLQQRFQRAAESAAVSVATWPPGLPAR